MSARRDKAIAPYIKKDAWSIFHSLEEFNQKYKRDWITGEVRFGLDSIDFSVKPKRKCGRLAVIFNSQQKPDSELKLFTWTKIAERLGCSRLHIADPVLNISEDAPIGWYTKNRQFNAQRAVGELIRSVGDALSINEFIFLGSSGGGFPAAYYTTVFENSTALLLAPTLSVPNSAQAVPGRPFISELNVYENIDDLSNSSSEVCFDLRERVPQIEAEEIGRIHILQSRADKFFWETQAQPFLSTLGFDCKKAPEYLAWGQGSAIFGNWADGHAPPPLPIIEGAIDALAGMEEGSLTSFMLPVDLLNR